MDRKQIKQEKQYGFPYHHIPSLKGGLFSQHRLLDWGYMYISHLEAVWDYLDDVPFKSLLDVGCGDGKFLYEMRKKFPAVSLAGNDYSERAVAFAKAFNFDNDVHFSTQPADKVSKEKGPFDVVTSIEVLEHIPLEETDEFCKSFASAIAPGGIGIITVPSDNRTTNRKHYQHFNEKSLIKTLEPHLEVTEVFFLNDGSYKSYIIQRILGNRFFVLNNEKAVNAVYKYYYRNLLRVDSKRCIRLMAVVKKR